MPRGSEGGGVGMRCALCAGPGGLGRGEDRRRQKIAAMTDSYMWVVSNLRQNRFQIFYFNSQTSAAVPPLY